LFELNRRTPNKEPQNIEVKNLLSLFLIILRFDIHCSTFDIQNLILEASLYES